MKRPTDELNAHATAPIRRYIECLEAEVRRLQITCDQRGKLIDGMEEEIEKLQASLATDIPQPSFCDCDGFCTGMCWYRKLERLQKENQGLWNSLNRLSDLASDIAGEV